LTTWWSKELVAEDLCLIGEAIAYEGVVNICPDGRHSLRKLYLRLKRRFFVELQKRFGLESPHSLGYDYSTILRRSLAVDADLYIGHQEQGVFLAYVLRRKGKRVAVDFEDWHSEDLLPEARQFRPLKLLRRMECDLLTYSAYSITTSNALAGALAQTYQVKPPEVIYNCFPLIERNQLDGKFKDRKDKDRISLIWFSQTIGPGRGLEMLMEALNQVSFPFEIHLRGKCIDGYGQVLRELLDFNNQEHLYIHELVPHVELLSRLSEHDIGLALELCEPPSRNLTVTNKILQYLLAGLPVFASKTAGQFEVAEHAGGAVITFKDGNSAELVRLLEKWGNSKSLLRKMSGVALRSAEESFCWERQETKLLELVSIALDE
jgi:glycosyltransferase involved in cell wall biosynthesis